MTDQGRTSREPATAPVSKTDEPKGLEGSTPSPSAHELWTEQGKSIRATHFIVVYDPDDKDTYPVFVMPENDVKKLCRCLELSEGHQKIKEIVPIKP